MAFVEKFADVVFEQLKKIDVFLVICSLVLFAAAEINFEAGPEDKCDVCKFFVRLIKENADEYKGIVTDPFKELVCKNTGKLKDVCMAFVEKFADVVFEQLKKIDEEKICQTMRLCEQVQILAMEAEMKNNIPCVVCEIIVKEITKQLGKSKPEIINALVQKCEALPKFQEQCKLAVMIYGERLIDWIVEKGQNPGVVCKLVGLCPKESRMYLGNMYSPETNDKAKCLFNCLKGKYPLMKIIEVVLKCKSDTKCYVAELGPDVINCVGQCLALDVDPETNNKAKCLFNCLKGKYPMMKILEVVLKCKSDTKCYVAELGPDVIDCLGQCLALEVDPESNDKAKCLFNCLKGKYSWQKILAVVLVCNTNPTCYAIELGPSVADCVGKCIVKQEVDPETNNKAKCLFDCLKGKYPLMKIIEVVLKCKSDTKCYVAELGPDVIDCVGHCLAVDVDPMANDKAKCLFDCLKGKYPLMKILEVVLKCKSDKKCYVNELGPDVLECLGNCLAGEIVDDLTVLPDLSDANCLFDCLKGKFPYQKILEVVMKCKKDVKCYIQELGPEVVDCVFQCRRLEPQQVDIVKCLFDCLKGKYDWWKIAEVVIKCRDNKQCYVDELGPDVLECLGNCLAEQPDEESINKAKCIFDCMMGRYTFERILAVVMRCKKDWMCYVAELGPDVKKCIAQCF
jgi:hypothetical protein